MWNLFSGLKKKKKKALACEKYVNRLIVGLI